MKKVLFLLVALATITCISCKKGETSAPTSAADTTAVTDSAAVSDTTAATAQVQIPTFDQVNNISDESVLAELGMTKLRENLTGQNEDTTGSIFYGKDAEVDGNGKITPKGEHAIVVEEILVGDMGGVAIHFSNKDDYNTYLQNNKKGKTSEKNGLYTVTYEDEEV